MVTRQVEICSPREACHHEKHSQQEHELENVNQNFEHLDKAVSDNERRAS